MDEMEPSQPMDFSDVENPMMDLTAEPMGGDADDPVSDYLERRVNLFDAGGNPISATILLKAQGFAEAVASSATHSFAVTGAETSWTIHPGGFFTASAVAIMAHIDGSDPSSAIDGGFNQVDDLSHTTATAIPSMQAGEYGVVFVTDHLGEVQWVMLDWKPASGLQEHDPNQTTAAYGHYFLPIVTFASDGDGGFTVSVTHRRSDIYWNAFASTLVGTTAPFTPPTPPAQP